MMKQILNGICVGLAFLCVGVGCIGIVLPILPTTPFFLLAVVLFAKGSQRFHAWFLSTGLYKTYLADFVATRSMTRETKIRVLTLVTILIAVGFWFSPVVAKVVLVAVLIFHYVYCMFGIKTIQKQDKKSTEPEIRGV